MIPRVSLTFACLTLATCLLSVTANAQGDLATAGMKLKRSYEQLSASYTVVADEEAESVYCKFNNGGVRPVLIVLSITKLGGGTSQREVLIPPGDLASVNIGNITSLIVSVTELSQGEDSTDRRIAERANIRDRITKANGKLSAIGFSGVADKGATGPKPVDVSAQTQKILELIFGAGSAAGMTFTDEDNKMAEFFLKEVVKGSCGMSLAEVLFKTAYSFDPDIQDIASGLIEAHGENCGSDAKKGKYYLVIIDAIRAKYRTAFANRKTNGEWLMTIEE